MTRISFALITFILFSCGQKSVTNDTVETSETTQNPKKQIANHEIQTDKPTDPLSFWDTLDLKVNKFIKGKTMRRAGKDIPQDFTDFYKRFVTDSTFQFKHIDFENIVGVYSHCDTTIQINSTNWVYSNWNLLDFFDREKRPEPKDGWDNRYYFDKKSIYFQLERPEVGMIHQLGFEKINGEWKMSLYVIYNC